MALAGAAESELLEALRAGDEDAFAQLVREYQASLVRVARIYVPTQAAAEEVAQETWLGVLKGLDRFEGRSSLRTWIFRILTNIAKTRAQRDGRTLPFSALQDPGRVPEAGPFTVAGGVNQGYLYSLSPGFARTLHDTFRDRWPVEWLPSGPGITRWLFQANP